MLAGMIATGIISLLFMSDINDNTTDIASNWLPSALIAEEINTTASDIRIQEYKHVISQNQQEMDLVNAELDKLSAKFENLCGQYTPLIANDTDRQRKSGQAGIIICPRARK